MMKFAWNISDTTVIAGSVCNKRGFETGIDELLLVLG